MFQKHRLMPWLTVVENLAFGRTDHVGRQADAEVSRYIDLVGLQGFERSYPHQLSGARLPDGREAVVKVQHPSAWLSACVC